MSLQASPERRASRPQTDLASRSQALHRTPAQRQWDLTPLVTHVASPEDAVVARQIGKYRISQVVTNADRDEYLQLLKGALMPLGLYSDHFLPADTSDCYKISFDGELVAIFRLTPVPAASVFHRNIPGADGKSIIEVNNVAVKESYRGDLLLGVILANCALLSHAKGFDIVAGVVRHDILPAFVDFGTIPVRHEPLHILGDLAICDYITYFMTSKAEHVDYALARSYHYFHRIVTMKEIRADLKELVCSQS